MVEPINQVMNETDLRNRNLTHEEIQRIDSQINCFVDSVAPTEHIMDAIWAVYTYLQGIIESSNTIKSRLGGSVELFPYGSVINGLFDVKKSTSGSKENPEVGG